MPTPSTTCSIALATLAALSCGDSSGPNTTGLAPTTAVTSVATLGTSSATSDATGTGSTTWIDPTEGVSITTWPATMGLTDPPVTSDPGSTSAPATTDPGTTTGFVPEYFMMVDPLVNGTMGTPIGSGSFGDTGWTVNAEKDGIYWPVPRLAEGSVSFTVTNITLANLPSADHEIFAMYEGGYGIEHPIDYDPEYRQNAFKTMIRIYGVEEVERTGQQKIMWGMCPLGAAWHEGCPCTNPPEFFSEPFGGDPNWDGSPQRFKMEWKDGWTRLYRNDVEALAIDWSGSGFAFGPQQLYVSLGTSRPLGPMPIGAVFSDVVIEGWTGPETPVCGQG